VLRIRSVPLVALAALVGIGAGPSEALAASGDVVIEQLPYNASTAGASLSGKFTHLTDATGANWYNVSFSLKDTGNEAKTVYAKWRYQVLVSLPTGNGWITTAAQTFANKNGYNTTMIGVARKSQTQLNAIAAGYSSLPAIKARVQVAVCRDAATDNCSGWQWATWTIYPFEAFAPGFTCNQTTMTVILNGVSGFVHPNFIPNGAFTLYVKAKIWEGSDWNLSNPRLYTSALFRIEYPNAGGLGTSISFVYLQDDPTNTPRTGDFSFTMTSGKYYGVAFDVWFTSAAAPVEAVDYPTLAFGQFSYQNGEVQGTPGDWRCVAY